MVDPVTLIVLVAAGEATSPMATAMVQATHDALGAAVVDVRETKGAPTDAAALAAEAKSRPDAVVEVVWDERDLRRITVRVHMARTQRWLERTMTYGPSDPLAERGRTLGLAIASILPEIGLNVSAAAPAASTSTSTSTPTPTPASAPAPAPAPAPVPAPASAPAASASASTPSASVPGAAPSFDRAQARSHSVGGPLPRFEFDLVANGAIGIPGIPGTADTLGVGGAAQWFPTRALSLRIGASERSGSLNIAEATVFTFLGTAGVTLHPWTASPSRPIDASLRVDYVLLREAATHSDDPSPVTRARWLSGVDGYVDAAWFLTADLAALVGIGVEDVLAPTYVNVRGTQVATIPALRLVAELGVRLRF